MEALATPEIFVFSLGSALQQSLLRDVHSHLMNALAAKSNLRQATNAQEALGLFDHSDRPKGVFVTDPGIVASKNDVRNGGTLDLGGLFSAQIRPNDLGSHEAVFLKHVDPGMAWYVATDRSVIESLVLLPGPGIDFLETSVVFAGLGNGWIGYVGDVNGEEGTNAIVLEMLGLTSNTRDNPSSKDRIV